MNAESSHKELRSLGAYCQLDDLIKLQLAAKSLSMKRNIRALQQLSGPYKSTIRGRGMEFEDVRLYQPGDDIRHIDWRVTARTGKAHSKRFREEREKPVIVLLDQRQNLFFGSKKATKSVLGADLAALIAWASVQKGDKFAGIVFNQEKLAEVPLQAKRSNVLQYLKKVQEFNQALNFKPVDARYQWQDIFQILQRVNRPGSRIFIISDFYQLDDSASAFLYQLARHSDVNAIHLYDPLEAKLPEKGLFSAFNQKTQCLFNSQSENPRWQAHFVARQQALKQQFGQLGISFISTHTEQAPLNTLMAYFGAK